MSITATNNPYPEDPDAAPTKLDRGGYSGNAQNLDEKITANLTEVKALIETYKGSKDLGSITPTSVPSTDPGDLGPAFWRATQNGVYTYFGGFTIPANYYAIFSRDGNGVFSVSMTALDVSSKVNVSDIVDNLTTDSATKVASSRQVKVLNGKFDKFAGIDTREDLGKFTVSDEWGNVILTIDKTTLSNPDYNLTKATLTVINTIINNYSTKFLTQKVYNENTSAIMNSYVGDFIITDQWGNIALQLNKDGFKFLGIENLKTEIVASMADKFYVNKIAIPSKLYMLSNQTNDIFKQPIVQRWNENRFSLRHEHTKISLQRENRTAIASPVNDSVLKVALYDFQTDNVDTIASKNITIKSATSGTGATQVYAQVMGDSWVHSAFFQSALQAKGYTPNLNLIGTRNIGGPVYNFSGIRAEGRGGWTLNSYFSVTTSETQCASPYYHPVGNFRYWGSAGYWKTVADYKNSTGRYTEFDYYYNQSCSTDCYTIYFNSNGTLKTPVNGDILFDNNNVYGLGANVFVIYNGSTWSITTQGAYTWAFDYSKYLTMFATMLGATTPKFYFVSLGINDFSNAISVVATKALFADWITKMDIVKASYISAVPTGKFAICIPLGSFGWEDSQSGNPTTLAGNPNFTKLKDAQMWEARKMIIDTYDNREAEAIYLLDVGLMIDKDFGYNTLTESPFSEYTGTELRIVQSSKTPHPSFSYPNAGVPLASFIQYYR
jgi:hypothetical protein